MTRTENIKRNLIFNMIKFATQIVLQFVLRTVLIYCMGPQYLGLNGLFTNIFAFLNLAELGIGSAIVFNMYKPIADGDTEKVKSLEALYKKFYLIISCVVFVIGILILPFIKYFISGEVTVNVNLYILYVMYLINTLVGYFSAHKRSLLFAHQRNDVENKIKTLCIAGMTIIQILVLVLTKNYYIFFAINIIFTVIECILIHMGANKLFPEINGKALPLDMYTKKQITQNITSVGMHKMGYAVISSTDNILISAIFGVVAVGVYSNYSLVLVSLTAICTFLVNALMGSVGNLIASSNKDYVYEKFKQINFMFVYFSAFTTICSIVLFQPFIKKWAGDELYLFEFSTVILICLSYYFCRMRTGVSMFKECVGLFKQDKWRPIIESIVNLVVSVALAQVIGINGIFVGTIVSYLVAPLWVEPFVLYKHYFKKSTWEYFGRYCLDILIACTTGLVCWFICELIPDGGILLLLVKFIICIIVCNVLLILAYFKTKEFKGLWLYIKKIANRLKKK